MEAKARCPRCERGRSRPESTHNTKTGWQERTLSEGSEHLIYRRYFTAEDLTEEIGGEVLFEGTYLVAVRR